MIETEKCHTNFGLKFYFVFHQLNLFLYLPPFISRDQNPHTTRIEELRIKPVLPV